ncbi:hypothetical protein CIPAW_06G009400 [Carya illinoinensis]|uniref:Uncharacterized protein n=1 Tax=Carya illinoinensis TaxID=32201 RepID=A0A8T1Q2Y2_CARIL|nr:hypothetical protein CIPAW_06G009400 [Carya illinoinensis]
MAVPDNPPARGAARTSKKRREDAPPWCCEHPVVQSEAWCCEAHWCRALHPPSAGVLRAPPAQHRGAARTTAPHGEAAEVQQRTWCGCARGAAAHLLRLAPGASHTSSSCVAHMVQTAERTRCSARGAQLEGTQAATVSMVLRMVSCRGP